VRNLAKCRRFLKVCRRTPDVAPLFTWRKKELGTRNAVAPRVAKHRCRHCVNKGKCEGMNLENFRYFPNSYPRDSQCYRPRQRGRERRFRKGWRSM
jgi:hypothetical protein